jgi:hypothetical protein
VIPPICLLYYLQELPLTSIDDITLVKGGARDRLKRNPMIFATLIPSDEVGYL